MYIEQVKTSKGIAIRYVFSDMDEYSNFMNMLKEIASFLQGKVCEPEITQEDSSDNLKALISLFNKYFEPEGKYTEGKPTVTVWENHYLIVASQIVTILNIDGKWRDFISFVNEKLKKTNEIYDKIPEE